MKGANPLAAMVDEPWRFDFYQALRALEAHHPNKPRLGTARKPADEAVRLGQAAELSFAPASLSAVTLDTPSGIPRIEVRFFGLFGPNGPLPLHLTEYARERALHHGDLTFTRFADLFHHRLLLLFYRAWAQAQPTVSLDRPNEDRFADHIGSLIGLGTPKHRGRDAAPDHSKLFFSGHLARQARNADGLQATLAAYLRAAVSVEQFVGHWLEIPSTERTRLGAAGASGRAPTAQLGAGATLGGTVFDRQHHFRIHVGPLRLAAFEALLPGGSALPAVQALLAHYVSLELAWDLRLVLASADVPACRPGRYGRLGWTTWLGRRAGQGDAALRLRPRAAGNAPH
ncbi:MAG: type VI secretion system baseplate subunit TssG [Burkholderiales bacterium]